MKVRFEKLYWIINIILPIVGMVWIAENINIFFIFLSATIFMWLLRWVVNGKHLTDNPFTGTNIIDDFKSIDKKNPGYNEDGTWNDPWKK